MNLTTVGLHTADEPIRIDLSRHICEITGAPYTRVHIGDATWYPSDEQMELLHERLGAHLAELARHKAAARELSEGLRLLGIRSAERSQK